MKHVGPCQVASKSALTDERGHKLHRTEATSGVRISLRCHPRQHTKKAKNQDGKSTFLVRVCKTSGRDVTWITVATTSGNVILGWP